MAQKRVPITEAEAPDVRLVLDFRVGPRSARYSTATGSGNGAFLTSRMTARSSGSPVIWSMNAQWMNE